MASIWHSGESGREVKLGRRNLEVLSSIPGSGRQLRNFFIGPHIWREYWCSSKEAESREISISCKNLFLNRCKINMFNKTIMAINIDACIKEGVYYMSWAW